LLGGTNFSNINIPDVDPNDVLFRVWLHFRNRIFNSAVFQFREELMKLNPNLFIICNTQYDYDSWYLANDLQYQVEDLVLSESVEVKPEQMTLKLLLGSALASNRPLLNYLGTWKGDDINQLKPEDYVNSILATSLAGGGLPWITMSGFHTPSPSLTCIQRHINLAQTYLPAAKQAKRFSNIVSLYSTRQRDYKLGSIFPSFASLFQKKQIMHTGVRIDDILNITSPDFYPNSWKWQHKFIIAEHQKCVSDEELSAVRFWLREGGILLTTADFAQLDEFGNLRNLTDWGLKQAGTMIIWSQPSEMLNAIASQSEIPLIDITPWSPCWDVTVYLDTKTQQIFVHIVKHNNDISYAESSMLTIGNIYSPTAQPYTHAEWWSTDGVTPVTLYFQTQPSHVSVSIPRDGIYHILSIPHALLSPY